MKIYINGEEVICDREFTIEQEMLNTPSVVLNNVYPKSWETTKDYTTNFFHILSQWISGAFIAPFILFGLCGDKSAKEKALKRELYSLDYLRLLTSATQ